jgi:hypothetical protein
MKSCQDKNNLPCLKKLGWGMGGLFFCNFNDFLQQSTRMAMAISGIAVRELW